MTAAPNPDRAPLTRSMLKGFPRSVQNALLAAYQRGASVRLNDGSHIMLFGTLAGRSGTLKVSGSRTAEDSVRFVEKWVNENYPDSRKLTMVTTPEPSDGLRELPAGFTVFLNKRTKLPNPKIGTNGTTFLCRVCGESMDTAVGASSHVRKAHENENVTRYENKTGVDVKPEALEFKGDPENVDLFEEKQKPQITIEPFDLPPTVTEVQGIDSSPTDDPRVLQAINLLLEVAGEDTAETIRDLEASNLALQQKLDECEARLALIRETLGV